MMVRLRFFAIACSLPVVLMSAMGLIGCSDSDGSGDSHNHSDTYYHSAGFHDPYYYGVYDYDDYDPVILPPSYNTGGNKPQKPDRPGSGERPGDGLRPSHPIAGTPGAGNRPGKPSVNPTSARRTPSIPSRARPSSMGRMGGGMRGGMRGGGRGGGRR